MKILYLTLGCFDKGGISRYCRYQITTLREIVGIQNLRTLSLRGPDKDSFEVPFDVTYFTGATDSKGKIAFAFEAFRQARSWNPDVILSSHINLSSLSMLLAKIFHAKVIENIYGLEVWSQKRKDSEWGLRKSDFIISDCHNTANYARENKLVTGGMEVIWDCVDTQRFFPGRPKQSVWQKYGIPSPDSGVNLLTLGRMVKEGASHKGYDRLLDVFHKISSKIPNLRLIYAGRGDLIEILKRKAHEKGISDRVFFTGSIEEADLADIYRSAHIFSLVSDCSEGRGEGIPLTPLEASACGLPILVGNQDGSKEAVIEGMNGFTLDPFDLTSHGEKILLLANDCDKRREMGEQASLNIKKEFNYSIFRDKHESILMKWLPALMANYKNE